jgi:hypothetical protein
MSETAFPKPGDAGTITPPVGPMVPGPLHSPLGRWSESASRCRKLHIPLALGALFLGPPLA